MKTLVNKLCYSSESISGCIDRFDDDDDRKDIGIETSAGPLASPRCICIIPSTSPRAGSLSSAMKCSENTGKHPKLLNGNTKQNH